MNVELLAQSTILVQQRGDYDCVLACLAMAVGRPYEELWSQTMCDAVEKAHGTQSEDLHDRAFVLAGLKQDTDYIVVFCSAERPSVVRRLLWGRRALLQVPSLNVRGGNHYVYWDGNALHDPSLKQRYLWLDACSPAWVTLLRA